MSFFSKLKSITLLGIGATAGATAAYFFDPDRGNARRAQATDQLGAAIRDQAGQLRDQADFVAGQAKGAVAERLPTEERRTYDARTLKEKVESEVLGRGGIDKSAIVVTADGDTVELRGQVPTPEQRRELVEATRRVAGVGGVRDLTHLPGEPAPNTASAASASR